MNLEEQQQREQGMREEASLQAVLEESRLEQERLGELHQESLRVEAGRAAAFEEAGRLALKRLREEEHKREAERLDALSHHAEQLRIVEVEKIANAERVNEEERASEFNQHSTSLSGERLLIPPPPPSRAELDFHRERIIALERQALTSDSKTAGLERQHVIEMSDLKIQVLTSNSQIAGLERQIRALTRQMSASSPIEGSSNMAADGALDTSGELSQGSECCICFDAPKTIVLFPCKHLCLCANCSATNTVTKCPLCFAEVQYKLGIFP